MSQTTVTPPAGAPSPGPISSSQPPRPWRWLARAFLTLWWTFVVALATGITQYLGNHAGPAIIPLLPQLLSWFREQALIVQTGLGALALVLMALMGWLTYRAWWRRHQVEHVNSPGAEILVVAEGIQTDVHKLAHGEPLPLVRELTRDLFKMGDPFAENVEYLTSPIQALHDTFSAAKTALLVASALPLPDSAENHEVSSGEKRGIVVVGEASAGKSRLVFEALTRTLPNWSALLWSEARTTTEIPPADVLHDRDVVIILDDLQNYSPVALATLNATAFGYQVRSSSSVASGPEAVLRELLRSVRQEARRTIIVTTCRSENVRATQAGLNWLWMQLAEFQMPLFSDHAGDPQATRILEFFREHGALHADMEWDGTLGSAVLGLKEKRAEYQTAVEQRHPAAPVLRAMKLLVLAGIPELTGTRIRHVCAHVFDERSILDDGQIWQIAVDKLLDLKFVRLISMNTSDEQTALAIRADPYFEYVVYDYPDEERQPGVRWLHVAKLQKVLSDLGDAPALFRFGNTLYASGRFDAALVAYDQALTLGGQNYAAVWYNKGNILDDLQRYDEALLAYDHALTIDPTLASAWYNKGVALRSLQRYDEALLAYDHALTIDPTLASAWYNNGLLLTHFKVYEKALLAFDHALSIDTTDAAAWTNKGIVLRSLARYEDALVAYDRALQVDPHDILAWYNKGFTLYSLQRYQEALDVYEHALSLNLQSERAQGWNGKAYALAAIGRYDDALASIEQAIELAPDNANFFDSKGEILMIADRYSDALPCFEKAVSLDPTFINSWKNLVVAYHKLGRQAEAQTAEKKAHELGG